MKGIITLLLVIIVVGGAWLLLKGGTSPTTPTTTTVTETTQVPLTQSAAPSSVTIALSDAGFSPAQITIKKGQAVMFVNNSSGNMWVASDVHPTHALYSGTTRAQHCPDTAGTAFDECMTVGTGGTFTFTFQKVGTWPYHNHVNASETGTVVVQ